VAGFEESGDGAGMTLQDLPDRKFDYIGQLDLAERQIRVLTKLRQEVNPKLLKRKVALMRLIQSRKAKGLSVWEKSGGVEMIGAGRELDAKVAEKVFGFTVDMEFSDTPLGPRVKALIDKYDEYGTLPAYSTDIADAWKVVELFKNTGYHVGIDTVREGWRCIIRGAEPFMSSTLTNQVEARAKTAPLAICEAALKV
jgi:hypothetical protein